MTPANAPLEPITRIRVRATGEIPRCRWCGARLLAATTVCDWCAETMMSDHLAVDPHVGPNPWAAPNLLDYAGYRMATP